MKILVNGEPIETQATSLADLLQQLGYGNTVVATAVNHGFAPAGRRTEIALREGDTVEILAPMQGG